MMRKVHYAMQGIIHRYFKRGLDKLVELERLVDREMLKDCMEDSEEEDDDEEGGSDDDVRDETESENESDREGHDETDENKEETDKVNESEEKHTDDEDENKNKERRIKERKMVKRFLNTVVTRYAQDSDGLLSILEAIYSGKQTVEDTLKENEDGNDHEARKQNDDSQEGARGMKDEQIDSSDEENDSEEYYVPDNKSHASLEFSDGERKYCHLSDVEEDNEVSCCGECDQCILGHYGYCIKKTTVRLRGSDSGMDEQESDDSGEESEESV